MHSYFPYRWSPASLIFNIYFYLCLYWYITRITVNNDTPHLKSPKNQNRWAALGRPAIKFTFSDNIIIKNLTFFLSKVKKNYPNSIRFIPVEHTALRVTWHPVLSRHLLVSVSSPPFLENHTIFICITISSWVKVFFILYIYWKFIVKMWRAIRYYA